MTDETSSNYDAQLSIDVNAKVLGEVYCDKNLALKGAVFGSVYTSNFIAKEFGSIYQNHLYNTTISQPDLAKQYVGLPFDNTISKVAKWLY